MLRTHEIRRHSAPFYLILSYLLSFSSCVGAMAYTFTEKMEAATDAKIRDVCVEFRPHVLPRDGLSLICRLRRS